MAEIEKSRAIAFCLIALAAVVVIWLSSRPNPAPQASTGNATPSPASATPDWTKPIPSASPESLAHTGTETSSSVKQDDKPTSSAPEAVPTTGGPAPRAAAQQLPADPAIDLDELPATIRDFRTALGENPIG